MKKKELFIYIGSGLAVLILLIFLAFYSLGMFSFFSPKFKNVEREVFENTKSYTYGVIQDLGNYYEQYFKAELQNEKDVIEAVIKVRFANFDSSKIQARGLRKWFERIRGLKQ